MRDSAFTVTNGQVTRAVRRTRGSNQAWDITVKPDSHAAVKIRLPGGSVETSDGLRVRMLLVHQYQGFRDRGVSLSFSYNPAPWFGIGTSGHGGTTAWATA